MEQLYRNIKMKREELGMSQEELAKKLNYKSRSSINKIELGVNDLPQSKIAEFAIALDTTVAELMGWENGQATTDQLDEWEEKYNPNGRLAKETQVCELIEECHGADAVDAVDLYIQLDANDRAEIRGEMKHMLKSDKYAVKKESKNA